MQKKKKKIGSLKLHVSSTLRKELQMQISRDALYSLKLADTIKRFRNRGCKWFSRTKGTTGTHKKYQWHRATQCAAYTVSDSVS